MVAILKRREISKRGGVAGLIDVQAAGMDQATEMLALLGQMGSMVRGGYLKAQKREEDRTLTNGDVLQFLAGNKKDGTPSTSHKGPIRDALPTKQDADEAGRIFVRAVEKSLNMISKRGKRFKRWDEKASRKFILSGKKKADQASASGLRKAIKQVRDRMATRISSGLFTPPTSVKYALWRLNKFSRPPHVTMKASGQTLKNVTSGTIKIEKPKTFGQQIGKEFDRMVKGALK
jgi:hypothetical protein